jgi:hypothetical protein
MLMLRCDAFKFKFLNFRQMHDRVEGQPSFHRRGDQGPRRDFSLQATTSRKNIIGNRFDFSEIVTYSHQLVIIDKARLACATEHDTGAYSCHDNFEECIHGKTGVDTAEILLLSLSASLPTTTHTTLRPDDQESDLPAALVHSRPAHMPLQIHRQRHDPRNCLQDTRPSS